jgi:Flp pilus assembly protein TadD
MLLRAILLSGLLALSSTGCIQMPGSSSNGSNPQFNAAPDAPEIGEIRAEPPPTFEEELARGDQLRNAGEFPKAVWNYLQSLRIDEANPLPRQRIGFIQLGKDPARAEIIFRELVEHYPEMTSAHLGLGLAHYARGHFDKARQSLTTTLIMDPHSAITITALGVIDDQEGDHEMARKRFERARKLAPTLYEIPNNLGMSYLMSEQFANAAREFEEAILINPNDSAVHNNLGYALGRMGKYRRALKSFRRYGSKAIALNNIGYTSFLNGDYQRAIRYYEAALMAGPGDTERLLVNLRSAEDALLEHVTASH